MSTASRWARSLVRTTSHCSWHLKRSQPQAAAVRPDSSANSMAGLTPKARKNISVFDRSSFPFLRTTGGNTMKRALNTLVCLFLLGGLATARAQQAGLIPVPVFQSIQVQAQTTFDAGARFYTYGYTVINPPSNTGQLRAVRVDITFPPSGGVQFRSFELTIPLGGQNLAFDEFVSRFLAPLKPPPMVTVGIQVPSGWNGGVGARGFAAFGASDPLNAVAPGQTIGLALISPGLP